MRLYGKVDGSCDRYDRPHFWGSVFDRPFYHVYPTLSRSPNFIIEEMAFDPTITTRYESGAIKSRPRFTTTKKKFEVPYNLLTAADKALLLTLQSSVLVGSDKFKWTNPDDDEEYWVRLERPMKFEMERREFNLWAVKLALIEA